MEPREVAKLDYNKLYQASRADGQKDDPSSTLKDMKNDKDFNRNKKVFFEGKVSETESVYNAATAKFFGANDQKKAEVGDKFGAVQATVDPQREAYRKSAAAFAGESY